MTAPSDKPPRKFVEIDPYCWALGVVDGFHHRSPRFGLKDQFGYASGRVEGQAAREQGLKPDDVLVKYRSPYKEAHFRELPPLVG